MRKLILNCLDVFKGCEFEEDAVLVERLMNVGCNRFTAEKIAIFVPLAFGRVLIEQIANVHFDDNFLVKDTNEQYIKLPLSSQELYISALSLANEALTTGIVGKEYFRSIAVGVLN